MPYAKVLPTTPGRLRGENVKRNPLYPMGVRLRSKASMVRSKTDNPQRHIAAAIARKLKPRKYPQEITQKEITREEREVALFDAAIAKYEKEKKCKEQK